MLILVRGRPRAGAETSGKAIGWNRPPKCVCVYLDDILIFSRTNE